ncbi:hypothetical protein AAXB25_14310 [Paenibacillus lautus]|uniref:DUF7352 domain-containing protein n=1 Tax=Paenibacillus lautus TaxID=1401 RepID=UPI003D29A828
MPFILDEYTVYKYPLDAMVETITMPSESKILSAIKQFNRVVVYALVNEGQMEMEEYEFLRVITGGISHGEWPLDNYTFLSTLVFNDGTYVEHVFYRKRGKIL